MATANYLSKNSRSRASHNAALDVVDAWDRDPRAGRLTALAKQYGTTTKTFQKYVPTKKVGGRLEPAPPVERKLFRGPQTMLADIDGRPQVVRVTPSNDAQWRAIQGHDKAVYAAVVNDDDSGLSRFGRRVVIDAETRERYHFFVVGDDIRDDADTGGFELQDLHYGGHARHNLDALLVDLGSTE